MLHTTLQAELIETPKASQIDTDSVERFLRVNGWHKVTVPMIGGSDLAWISDNGNWRVEIDDVCISIFRYVGDRGGSPYALEGADCADVKALEAELVSVGAMEWTCPNCGRAGGHPRTVHSSEFQGDSAHGGRVYFADQCCSKCTTTRWV